MITYYLIISSLLSQFLGTYRFLEAISHLPHILLQEELRRHEAVLPLPQDHHRLAHQGAQLPHHAQQGAKALRQEHARHALLKGISRLLELL